jgi:hypothetical protein
MSINSITLLIDGHIHVYNHYDLSFSIYQSIENLQRSARPVGDWVPIWLLAERSDCHFFDEVVHSDRTGLKIEPHQSEPCLIVKENDKPILYIMAGRQIVSTDGLEVISVATKEFIPDRTKSTMQIVEQLAKNGGISIINWAPGKWFFSRGKVVQQLIEHFSPKELLVGDTTLRMSLWPMPKLMKQAAAKGFKIIAGSDPLPFKKEERMMGQYGFRIFGDFEVNTPATSLVHLLKDSSVPIHLIGKRNTVPKFVIRQTKIMLA